MKRKAVKMQGRATARRTRGNVRQPIPGGEIFPLVTPGIWSGSIGRLRLYRANPGLVYAFKSPGDNDNFIGTTDDRDMVRALFLARDNGRTIWGYTDNQGIVWLDY